MTKSKNMAMFDFESICVQENKIRDTDTTTWIGKHVPISVFTSPNVIGKPILSCNSNPGALVESSGVALDELATQSKAQMKLMFSERETSVKSERKRVFPILINVAVPRNRLWNLKMSVLKKESKTCRHRFYKLKKNQLTDSQDQFQRYCNVFPVFGFISQNYDIILKKSYLLLLLVNEREIEAVVIEKANQFVFFKFGDVQLLDTINFPEEPRDLSFSLKPTRLPIRKSISDMNGMMIPKRLTILNFILTKPSSASCATFSFSKKTTQIFKNPKMRAWNLKKPEHNWNWSNYLELDKKLSKPDQWLATRQNLHLQKLFPLI